MANERLTQEVLTGLLQEAEAAHAVHERTLGHRDENWAAWYAAFILQKLQEEQDKTQQK